MISDMYRAGRSGHTYGYRPVVQPTSGIPLPHRSTQDESTRAKVKQAAVVIVAGLGVIAGGLAALMWALPDAGTTPGVARTAQCNAASEAFTNTTAITDDAYAVKSVVHRAAPDIAPAPDMDTQQWAHTLTAACPDTDFTTGG